MDLIKKAIDKPWLILPYIVTRIGKKWDDERYIKVTYFLRNGRWLDLDKPQSYFEKINWIKLHDRRPEYTLMVDKYACKQYVSEKIGEEYIIPTIAVWERADEIDICKLPDQFVLKTTHDGGNTFICRDKNSFDMESAKRSLQKSLERNYYFQNREWPYKDVPPRIICEPYIPGIVDSNYKFFCFDGKVMFLYVAPYRELTADYFDAEWNHLKDIHNVLHTCAETPPVKPDSFEKMKEIAEILSGGFPQMRVDLYVDNGKIYFGEITFFQEGGMVPWIPDEWNDKFGKYIVLSTPTSNKTTDS